MHANLANSGWKQFIDRLRKFWQGPPLQIPVRIRTAVPRPEVLHGPRLR